MTQLTEERFAEILTEKLAPLATKADVSGAVEELARIIADTVATPFTERFDRLEEAVKERKQIEVLRKQVAEIREMLHLTT